ncbi:SMI1/KNR4 family protein [Bacillus sp. FJAT-52991]|uniref:SMI1/KNR4 family protein n=1 Tax=Bacillus kandeliae TaxID=3129297 RepID=A0ABZ2NAA5_9BACI
MSSLLYKNIGRLSLGRNKMLIISVLYLKSMGEFHHLKAGKKMKNYLQEFWGESDYFTISIQVKEKMIEEAEQQLGYKLPDSYIELIKIKNGGRPVNTIYPMTMYHIAIDGIRGIGGNNGIDGEDAKRKYKTQY